MDIWEKAKKYIKWEEKSWATLGVHVHYLHIGRGKEPIYLRLIHPNGKFNALMVFREDKDVKLMRAGWIDDLATYPCVLYKYYVSVDLWEIEEVLRASGLWSKISERKLTSALFVARLLKEGENDGE